MDYPYWMQPPTFKDVKKCRMPVDMQIEQDPDLFYMEFNVFSNSDVKERWSLFGFAGRAIHIKRGAIFTLAYKNRNLIGISCDEYSEREGGANFWNLDRSTKWQAEQLAIKSEKPVFIHSPKRGFKELEKILYVVENGEVKETFFTI